MKTSGKFLVCHYKQCNWYCCPHLGCFLLLLLVLCTPSPSCVCCNLMSMGPVWWEGVQLGSPLPGWRGLQVQSLPQCSLAQTWPPPRLSLCPDVLGLCSAGSLCYDLGMVAPNTSFHAETHLGAGLCVKPWLCPTEVSKSAMKAQWPPGQQRKCHESSAW